MDERCRQWRENDQLDEVDRRPVVVRMRTVTIDSGVWPSRCGGIHNLHFTQHVRLCFQSKSSTC